MRIVSLDPAGDETDRALMLPCLEQNLHESYGDYPVLGSQHMKFWCSTSHDRRSATFGVLREEPGGGGERLAGYVTVGLSRLENLDLADAVLMASPDGEAGVRVVHLLLDHARRYAREQGRRRLSTGQPETAADRYAPVRAGRPTFTAMRVTLDLHEVARERGEQFAAWAAPSPANGRYRLERWVNRCPDELAAAYVRALAAMEDAPMEDKVLEHPALEVDRLREDERHLTAHDVREHVVAAVTADGVVGGFTSFGAYPEHLGAMETWGTGVIAEHRGRGLGLRLKAEAISWMCRQYPQAGWVHTFNNHGNEHMLAVNDKLGFRPTNREQSFEFDC
jgi:RimJ/RimL family protein N-acetyltransferase